MQTATVGGGCFWCLEAVYEGVRGVEAVTSGYSGGSVDAPTYEAVCGGQTGHAEVVQIRFDETVVDYQTLLEIFFGIHDPTTPDRQGNDIGPQYRSIIFTHDQEQADTARAVIRELSTAGVFDRPIVTQLEQSTTFWPAEAYHNQYFSRNPQQPYCSMVVGPKVAKFRERFANLLR